MNIVLFDPTGDWKNLLPFTYTRPVSEIRCGILTIREKWERALNAKVFYHTQPYLQKKFPAADKGESVFVNATVCPDKMLADAVMKLKKGEALFKDQKLLAFAGEEKNIQDHASFARTEYTGSVLQISNVWDIFRKNGEALQRDFELLSAGRKSFSLSKTVTVIGDPQLLFLEEGAKAEACTINTSTGPVYLGKDSEVMEGSVIRGPFSLGEHSTLKLSAKVYGPTTIGPHCKVGGEVSNSVIFGYSNKAHDGFIGNSVLGEWCNLGADTNCSNLKNNYGNVKVFSYHHNKPVDSGLQFCGLMMGDHSKSGINTMFNTGTVVGAGCNIFGGGFPDTHIPAFSWGGAGGLETYLPEKMFETAQRVYERRGMKFDETEQEILRNVFELTKIYRPG